jgi:integrase
VAWAGARPSEAFTVTPGGIYRDAGKLWVVESKRQRARHASREKGRRALLLKPLLDDLDPVMELRRDAGTNELLLWLSERFDEDDLRNWRRRWFEPAAEAIGIEATPKSLRHAFASVSAAAGINDVFTAAEMGHSLTVHREKYVKPLTRYAAVPFSGTEGAERMIYEARQRAMSRVGAWLERKGSLAGLAADLREEVKRDREGSHNGRS